MLLKQTTIRPPRSHRMLTMLRDDEQGAAMAAVLGLMATLLLLSTLVVASVFQSTGFTAMSRASIQSQASAEAGIAAARTALIAGECATFGPEITNTDFGATSPVFSATIMIPNGSGWTPGCPASAAIPVRILSTGSAEATGVGGLSAGDETTLEAMLEPTGGPVVPGGTGHAVFSYKASGLGGGAQFFSVGGSVPSLYVKTGNVTCGNNVQQLHDIILESGSLRVEGSCYPTGDLWASSNITITNGGQFPNGGKLVAGGNVVAEGWNVKPGAIYSGWNAATDTWATSNGNVNSGYNLIVNGPIYARGNVSLSGASVNGPVYAGGTLNPTNPNGAYPEASGAAGLAALPSTGPGPRPTIPNWFDYRFDTADMTDKWAGFGYYDVPSTTGTCGKPQIDAALAANPGIPVVIDARDCAGGIYIADNFQVTINEDIAIIAPKFVFDGSGRIVSGDSTNHKIWILTEDTNTATTSGNPTPHCPLPDSNPGDGLEPISVQIAGDFNFGTNPSSVNHVMIYTPCRAWVRISNPGFYGQVFAGEAQIDNNSHFYYVPVGIPGYDLNEGVEIEPTGSELERVVGSIRNVSD